MKLALLLTVIAFLIDPAISAGFEYLENGGRYLINAVKRMYGHFTNLIQKNNFFSKFMNVDIPEYWKKRQKFIK